MRVFPTKELKFKLVNTQAETLDRLLRRTEKSENLASQFTDKSFRGQINVNQFKLISSAIGKGAFCVLSGQVNSVDGIVKVEINKVFRIILSIILLLPVVVIIANTFRSKEEFYPMLILGTVAQILVIRFIFIEIIFRLLSRESLKRLQDILDCEWVKN